MSISASVPRAATMDVTAFAITAGFQIEFPAAADAVNMRRDRRPSVWRFTWPRLLCLPIFVGLDTFSTTSGTTREPGHDCRHLFEISCHTTQLTKRTLDMHAYPLYKPQR